MSDAQHQPAAPPVAIGSVVAGKYLIEGLLGEGGMGVVLAARHVQIRQRVALKFLRADLAAEGDTAARFLREAQSAARISNEHVARVLDVGTLPDGLPFMVMELLEGEDLARTLEVRGALPVEEAVDCVLQALEALGEAHNQGIVHRDVKPSNLFLCRRRDGSPLVKVLDFGLSKDVSEDRRGQSLTRSTSAAMGSPLYMSPEQIRSMKSVTFASDQWSIGVVLFELLTDDVPFRGDTVAGLLAAVVADAPLSVRDLRPQLPVELGRVIARCLEKNQASRYAHLGELALALAPFASPAGKASAARVAALLGSFEPSRPADPRRVVVDTPSLEATTFPLPTDPPPPRWTLIVGTGAAAAVVVVAVVVGLRVWPPAPFTGSIERAGSATAPSAAREAPGGPTLVGPDSSALGVVPSDPSGGLAATVPSASASASASALPIPSPGAPAASSPRSLPPRGRPGPLPPPTRPSKPVESLIDSRN